MAGLPDIATLSSTEVYRNPWTRVREDRIRRADGSEGIYGVVEKADFAVVIPLDDGQFHMVEQYRYPVGGRFWEFPQGAPAGDAELSPEALARAELAEETGLVAADLTPLGRLHPNYGICDCACDVFLATGLTPGPPRREIEEQDMITRAFPVAEVLEMVRSGVITDGPTVAAIGLLLLKGHL